MTRRKAHAALAEDRKRKRAEIAEWMADYERTHARLLPEYEEARREWQAADAERIAACKELHRHDVLTVRAFSDRAPFDWEGKLALRGYDRDAHEAARRCASSAEERSEKARERMIAIGNQIHFPARRANILMAEIGESYEPAARGRARSSKNARAVKKARAAAVDGALGPEARAMKRRNPQMSNATVAGRLSRMHFAIILDGEEKIMRLAVGPKRVARWLASG